MQVKSKDFDGNLNSCRNLMQQWTLDGEDLVGIGTDGANVMCGQHHSLVTLLKRTWPHIVHLKCVCHSIDLIAKNAVKSALPSHIDFLIRESYNWFAHSSQRLNAYQDIASLIGFSTTSIGEGEDEAPGSNLEGTAPPRLISPSDTRWLVLAECIEKILGQYDALKAHFSIAYNREKCYQAKVLAEMYNDEKNFLYLLMIFPVLKELHRLTKLFQANSPDNFQIYVELETAFQSLGQRLLKPAILRDNSTENLAELNIESEFCLLEPQSVDLGSAFFKRLQNSKLSSSDRTRLLSCGQKFLKEVFVGFQRRLSGSLKLMRSVSKFSIDQFSTTDFKSENFISPFFPQDIIFLSSVEGETKLLKTLKLEATATDEFWIAVHNYQDAAGSYPFRSLSGSIIKMLCLPISNAEVERVFSQVNLIRNSRRSRVKIDLLQAILLCKFGLSKFGKTVSDFKPPVELLNYDSTIYD